MTLSPAPEHIEAEFLHLWDKAIEVLEKCEVEVPLDKVVPIIASVESSSEARLEILD